MQKVTCIQHPLVEHHLGIMREKNTPPEVFRANADRLATLVAYEATQDLLLDPVEIETPLTATTAQRLKQRIGIVPILRAGLSMVAPISHLIPSAEVWHLGFYRDEATLRPVPYYDKLSAARPVDVALITDPMLATGGSAIAAISSVETWGVTHIKLICMLAAPEGIAAVHRHNPNVQIFVCAVDEKLNERGYIDPGLGDAGDRIFNTLH